MGTGRNTRYYPIHKCTSITLVDSSPSMLDQARKNFRGSVGPIYNCPPLFSFFDIFISFYYSKPAKLTQEVKTT